jgi:hypothetical protein
MALEDWDWRYPVEYQDVPWDCAAASLCWALNAAGVTISESEVVSGLGPGRISPEYGLLDASGAGIVDWLATIGIGALNNPSASWDEVYGSAGYQPMIIGGRAWYHWSGLRVSAAILGRPDVAALLLANPAPGWEGVGTTLDPGQFYDLGPFSAVWFTDW